MLGCQLVQFAESFSRESWVRGGKSCVLWVRGKTRNRRINFRCIVDVTRYTLIENFIDNSFRDGQVRTTGTDIGKILPPMSRFGGGNRQEKKKSVIEKIQAFFERYFGL